MPSFLANVNPYIIYERLRAEITEGKKANIQLSSVISILEKHIQRARYEEFMITRASAYSGYTLWFPAFVYFRGRIYRTGILNFHFRDLARSLLLMVGSDLAA